MNWQVWLANNDITKDNLGVIAGFGGPVRVFCPIGESILDDTFRTESKGIHTESKRPNRLKTADAQEFHDDKATLSEEEPA